MDIILSQKIKLFYVVMRMNKAQIIKTFLHEMAHAELHHADNPQKENLTRSTAELQAESVAYVVSSYYGIDTSEYSFNYLSGWSG